MKKIILTVEQDAHVSNVTELPNQFKKGDKVFLFTGQVSALGNESLPCILDGSASYFELPFFSLSFENKGMSYKTFC